MRPVTVMSMPGFHYTVLIGDGQHTWLADESPEFGGEGCGPSPTDTLLAALGSSTAITLRMYAERKDWPLTNVSVELTKETVLVADCDECSQAERAAARPDDSIDLIRYQITLGGNLDPDQKARLLEMAERSPVRRLLTTPPKLIARIANPA